MKLPIRLVLMLSIGLLINYVDRGTISVAAPLLEKEFALSPDQMGWVLSAWRRAPWAAKSSTGRLTQQTSPMVTTLTGSSRDSGKEADAIRAWPSAWRPVPESRMTSVPRAERTSMHGVFPP